MMHKAQALEFPFMPEVPRRERSRLNLLIDQLNEWKAAEREHGTMLPIRFAAKLCGVSHERLGQLVQEGRIVRVDLGGHVYVTEKSVIEWAQSERKVGRPVKPPGPLTILKEGMQTMREMQAENSRK